MTMRNRSVVLASVGVSAVAALAVAWRLDLLPSPVVNRTARLLAGAPNGVKAAAAVVNRLFSGLRARTTTSAESRSEDTTSSASTEAQQGAQAAAFANVRNIRPVERLEKRGFTKEELGQFNGVNHPQVYISAKRVVYDVDPHFYGPGQDYHVFAGKEISRCLAKSQVSDVEANKYWVPGCTPEELSLLDSWVTKFARKYPVVGWYVPDDAYFNVSA